MQNLSYTSQHPVGFSQVLSLYEALSWNSLNLSTGDLKKMCRQSWYVVYAYDTENLVGMGRVISDGVITGVICGVGVHPDYQSAGIGTEIMKRLSSHCEKNGVIPQLMCVESLEPYYEKLGFEKFTIGMRKNIVR
ncbi:GNAT family N-acetyltransferase [Neobacillus notoginsengisoli]|uniref:GNAT family N-acetyltransferase n=1 Tax=Neobacillus notoginsengisoli TaxID=1578198 RepID=A0A417YWP4_9BACI|nr:GNAT family N-acetyltransferase [Neobacillus notoginsengisoli]RHW42017.1 GNAT family N-acetyltransferase [Neobacillus notoginsengisoli]